MSGHYATLLRGTVEAFLPHYDVYITDWTNARMVPKSQTFDLDDYIDYLIEICHALNVENLPLHTVGVCQPAVPLIAAIALMEADHDPKTPTTMTLMGGPIDTRRSPTAVNQLAEKRGSQWFRDNCIVRVPYPYPGFGRSVYPGFMQLSGFMAMNIDRHVDAHVEMYNHLVAGDGESGEKQRDFYDEYLAVMDLTAEFYLQTIDAVFVDHQLPKGVMTPPQQARRPLGDPTLRAAHGRRRERRHLGHRPDAGGRSTSAPTCRRIARPTICRRMSGITVSSTAPASVATSFRAWSSSRAA